MSKPIHPMSSTADRRGLTFPEFDSAREPQRHSSGSSSVDFTDVSESFDSSGRFSIHSESFKCTICERFLSQRSPWSSRRIVRNGDMPVASVLSCRHVFHADCLDRETHKATKNDPPCPLCGKSDDSSSPRQRISSKLKINLPRLTSCDEDGPSSRTWDCGHTNDCVESALHAPPRNTMSMFSKSRLKSLTSTTSNSDKEILSKIKKK